MSGLSEKSRILAIDVGAGTQDILLYHPEGEPENSVKLVLPSQTRVLARRISRLNSDILLAGETMGGGPMAMAIAKHIEKGYRVLMTESSARSIRDDLQQVKSLGVEIVSEELAGSMRLPRLETRDVDLELIFNLLTTLGEPLPEVIGVAVQDHGHMPGRSERRFRFERIREMLESGAGLADFLFQDPPSYYTRMNAVIRGIKRSFKGEVLVVDTKFAAIAGALHGVRERPVMCMDIGNGHTMMAVVDKGIEALLEHHTHALTGGRLVEYAVRLANGEVSNDEVYGDDGHGCYVRRSVGMQRVKKVLVTGPKRRMLNSSELKAEFANPLGDVMMTGPAGIIDLALAKLWP